MESEMTDWEKHCKSYADFIYGLSGLMPDYPSIRCLELARFVPQDDKIGNCTTTGYTYSWVLPRFIE
jgi:hypothetical protein